MTFGQKCIRSPIFWIIFYRFLARNASVTSFIQFISACRGMKRCCECIGAGKWDLCNLLSTQLMTKSVWNGTSWLALVNWALFWSAGTSDKVCHLLSTSQDFQSYQTWSKPTQRLAFDGYSVDWDVATICWTGPHRCRNAVMGFCFKSEVGQQAWRHVES